MSDDLISRNELHKQLSLYIKRCNINRTSPSIEGLAHIINNLPTAYDTDKVLENIEGNSYEKFGHIRIINTEKAIEIVKAGGVSEI